MVGSLPHGWRAAAPGLPDTQVKLAAGPGTRHGVDMDSTWDCIVVGGGAAGLSCALVLGRARQRTLIVDEGRQSNLAAHGIGGLLGQDGRPAGELYAQGRAELRRYRSVEFQEGRVFTARKESDGFAVELPDGTTAWAPHLVLATGARYEPPEVDGIEQFWGRTVFHCPFCHGWEARDGQLGVLDRATSGVDRALLLRTWSDDVTLFTEGRTLEPADLARLTAAGVTVDPRPVQAVSGEGDQLAAVEFTDGGRLERSGLLVSVGLLDRGGLADLLGVTRSTEGPFTGQTLGADAFGATNVPGVWAIGDTGATAPSVAAAISTGSMTAGAIVHAQISAPAGTAGARA